MIVTPFNPACQSPANSAFLAYRINPALSQEGLDLRQAVAAWLREKTLVTNIVGNAIYFGPPSQRASYPCLCIVVSDRSYGHNLGGADGSSVATVTLAGLGSTQAQAVAVARAIRNFAQGFRGLQSGVAILSCLLEDEADDQYPPPDGTDRWIYQVSIDYRIKHRVPLPTSVTQNSA